VSEPTDGQLLRSQMSDICPTCGLSKLRRQTLCRTCYGSLPKPLQRQLYTPWAPWGHGYCDAVRDAAVFLDVEQLHLPEEAEA